MMKIPMFYPAVFCCLLLSLPSLSGQTVVTFLNPSPAAPVACGDTWTESGIPQSFDPSLCSFDYSGGDLWLFPATLILDLSGLGTIDSVQVDITDWCNIGCSYARFFQAGSLVDSIANATSNVPETLLFVNSAAAAIDEMTITSFEGQIFEIRIYHTAGPAACPPDADIHTESGDVYVEDSCRGVILKSPNGTCFRIRVDDNGGLMTEQVACPD